MARRYDSGTTTFSPEGRLYQVEYAIGAINNAPASVGILSREGVVIAAEKKVASKLLAPPKSSEKMLKIDEHILASVAGLTADASILVEQARTITQRHRYTYSEDMPVEQLVTLLADYKHGYTQYGGLRPFGCSFLFGGYDRHYGFQLYQSDPSGNYSGWKATAIGANATSAAGVLKADYAEGCSLAEAEKLAVKVLCKALDTAHPTHERMEVAVLTWADVAAAMAAGGASVSTPAPGSAGASAPGPAAPVVSTGTGASESKEGDAAAAAGPVSTVRRDRGPGAKLVQVFLSPAQVDALIAEAVPAEAGAAAGAAKASI